MQGTSGWATPPWYPDQGTVDCPGKAVWGCIGMRTAISMFDRGGKTFRNFYELGLYFQLGEGA